MEIYQICMKRVGNRHQFLGVLASQYMPSFVLAT